MRKGVVGNAAKRIEDAAADEDVGSDDDDDGDHIKAPTACL